MKKITRTALIALLSLFILSCSTVNVEKYQITHIAGFLWKIESSSTTVYLLGSIHLAQESLYPLDNRIEKAFDESDNLVVELNIEKVNQVELLNRSTYQDDNSLKKNVSQETYKLLQEFFAKLNIPESVYSKFKPWLAIITILAMELAKDGFDESYGIDKHFLKEAGESKNILELETVDEQLKIFEEFESNIDVFIGYSLDDMNESLQQVDELFESWKSGDVGKFEKIINSSLEGKPEYEDIQKKLFDDRNIKMVKKIKGYLASGGTYFVVVGGGHLVGEKGIISLLSK